MSLESVIMETAGSYAIPICWVAANSGKPVVPANGTGFLLDCGEGPFLVTAAHVYKEGHLEICKKHIDAVCVVGGIVGFNLSERLKALDASWDVATFHVEEKEIRALQDYGKIVLMGSQMTWPPVPPQVNQGIFFLGFPGRKRILCPYRGQSRVEVEWVGESVLTHVNDVNQTDITMVLDYAQTPEYFHGKGVPVGEDFGGCSGAPLFTFVEAKGVFSWQLAGVIVRAYTLDKEGGLVIVQAARADCILPDGRIVPNPRAL